MIILEFECPLCNALITVMEICPWCQNPLEDQGPVENFFDPYNPYDETTMVKDDSCIHLFYCNICGYDTHITVNQIDA